jgi:GT2 family glycosyltransferase
MTDSPLVSIVIVSFNTRRMTCDCIQSVGSVGWADRQQVIVLDNASHDGSADAIGRLFPEVELIRSTENLGFAKGNNVAAKRAKGEYILLLNPDTIVLDDAIGKLIAVARREPNARIWGGRTLHGDMTLNEASCWRFMSLWSIFANGLGLANRFPKSDFFNPEAYGGWERDTERVVDMVSGCFLLIKRDFWEELGGFDETFYIYAEEADLCYRARQRGAQPMVSPVATIIHLCGGSTAVRATKLEQLWKGKVTFIRKHWPRWKASLGISIMKLHALIRWFGFGLSGALRGRTDHKQAAHEWKVMFQSRANWESGYLRA